MRFRYSLTDKVLIECDDEDLFMELVKTVKKLEIK